MTKKQKKMLYRIIVTFLLFAVLMVCEHTGRMDGWNKIVLFVIYLVPYLVIGYDIGGSSGCHGCHIYGA